MNLLFRSAMRALITPLLAAVLGSSPAYAQSGKPIRILVGFPAGGGTDAIARTLAEHLKDPLGVPVIVENRAGAGGQIAAQALKAAAPDGTTYFISHDHTISILPLVMKNPGFDPTRDFVPVAGFATFVNALALSGGTPPKTFRDYVAWVRGQRQVGDRGAGTGIGAGVPGQGHRRKVRSRPRRRALSRKRADDRRHARQSDSGRHRLGAGTRGKPQGREAARRRRARCRPAGRDSRGADLRRTRPRRASRTCRTTRSSLPRARRSQRSIASRQLLAR